MSKGICYWWKPKNNEKMARTKQTSRKSTTGTISPKKAIDRRSSAVRTGFIVFRIDGTIDARCAGARSGDVIITKTGGIDKRSKVVRSGQVKEREVSPSKKTSPKSTPTTNKTSPTKGCASPTTPTTPKQAKTTNSTPPKKWKSVKCVSMKGEGCVGIKCNL